MCQLQRKVLCSIFITTEAALGRVLQDCQSAIWNVLSCFTDLSRNISASSPKTFNYCTFCSSNPVIHREYPTTSRSKHAVGEELFFFSDHRGHKSLHYIKMPALPQPITRWRPQDLCRTSASPKWLSLPPLARVWRCHLCHWTQACHRAACSVLRGREKCDWKK